MKNKNKNKSFLTPVSKKFIKTLREWRDEQNKNYEAIKKFIDDSYKNLKS